MGTNLAEAEFSVGLFMFLRLQQVRGEYISIFSPYAEQKNLIKEILRKKCGWHENFGMPAKVVMSKDAKADSNSVVILSLVERSVDLKEVISNAYFYLKDI